MPFLTDSKKMLQQPTEPMRALIVEDDMALQLVLSQLLRSKGFVTRAVSTVAEGLQELRENAPPHCVLLDLSLPDGEGIRILQHIRAKGIPAKVAVVTGTANHHMLAEVSKLDPDKILRKPFGVRDVQDWLTMAVEMKEIARIRQAIVA